MSSYEGVAYTSRPVGVASNGQQQTLLQTLQLLVPSCFTSDEVFAPPDAEQSSGAAPSPPAVDTSNEMSQADVQQIESLFLQRHVVLIAGVQPPLQTPLISLHAALHAPDMFLYITVIAHQTMPET